MFVDIFWILHPGSLRFALKKADFSLEKGWLTCYSFDTLYPPQRQVKLAISNNHNFVKDIQAKSCHMEIPVTVLAAGHLNLISHCNGECE